MSTSPHTVEIDLGDRSYPIHIGSGLTEQTHLQDSLKAQQVLIVSNETVAPLYLDKVRKALGNRLVETVILPDGEQYKSLEVMNLIFDGLLQAGFGRDCCVIALGGGVIGDMAGYAAASYQRGVSLVQIPTSLLAQVDSSVGGKTAVNHALGKNMIGAFHQPDAVVIDTDMLATLEQRELIAGLAEIIKYGFIHDADFFTWLEENSDKILQRDTVALTHAIRRSCEIKAEIVAADEREHGIRAHLNFGHTFGHAIENLKGYGNWLHGEAVAAGMCLALDMSVRMGWLESSQQQRGIDLIKRAGLPVKPPGDLTSEAMKELMSRDKKVQDGQIRLILLQAIGKAATCDIFDPQLLDQTLQQGLEPA